TRSAGEPEQTLPLGRDTWVLYLGTVRVQLEATRRVISAPRRRPGRDLRRPYRPNPAQATQFRALQAQGDMVGQARLPFGRRCRLGPSMAFRNSGVPMRGSFNRRQAVSIEIFSGSRSTMSSETTVTLISPRWS